MAYRTVKKMIRKRLLITWEKGRGCMQLFQSYLRLGNISASVLYLLMNYVGTSDRKYRM